MDARSFANEAVGLHDRLARAVFAICGDASLAEDSAQEALVRAWERVDAGEELASLEAWSMTVSLNWCRQQLRRRGAERRALHRVGPPVPEELETRTLAEDVTEAVLALPRRQREVVVLHYLLDLGVDSIAEVVGSSSGAVRNALFHARSALSVRLAPAHPGQEASR